jgi:hypothetical protein
MLTLRRSHREKRLRYYLYISDTKLNMLFEQIDESLRRRISAEVRVDIKIASLTLNEVPDPGPTRMAKLRIVERFIDANHHVGDFEEPGAEYFRGQMPMRWGRVQHTPVVCFVAGSSDDTRGLMLAGSVRHVLSEAPFIGDSSGYSGSQLSNITHFFKALYAGQIPETVEPIDAPIDVGPGIIKLRSSYEPADTRDWVWDVCGAWRYLHEDPAFPIQHLEFLAIPLATVRPEDIKAFYNREMDTRIVIATPLYVAMASVDPAPKVGFANFEPTGRGNTAMNLDA